MKRGLKIQISRKSGFSRGFITRIFSKEDPCKPSWPASKIFAFVTDTDPVLWADKNIDALKSALADTDPTQLRKYDPKSQEAA